MFTVYLLPCFLPFVADCSLVFLLACLPSVFVSLPAVLRLCLLLCFALFLAFLLACLLAVWLSFLLSFLFFTLFGPVCFNTFRHPCGHVGSRGRCGCFSNVRSMGVLGILYSHRKSTFKLRFGFGG